MPDRRVKRQRSSHNLEQDVLKAFLQNICNRTSSGKGVQLELSNGLRRSLFDDWRTRQGRKTTTSLFAKLASDIRDILE
jgi:phage replication-related protein YjqB (UPF0714/DUF867 family)